MDWSVSQLMDLGEERDLVDAELILDDFKRAKRFKGKDQFSALMRLANKSLVTFWETPRLPYPKFTHNKPHGFLWSKNARDLYFSGEKIDSKLILEHIYPTDLKAKLLLELTDVTVSLPKIFLNGLRKPTRGFPSPLSRRMKIGSWRVTIEPLSPTMEMCGGATKQLGSLPIPSFH